VELEVSLPSPPVQNTLHKLTLYLSSDVLKIMRRLRPNEKFLDDYVDGRDLSTVDNARPIDILKTLSKAGFTSLEESIKDNIEGL
jgi:hypothetical protein